jgi:hypothetical protein
MLAAMPQLTSLCLRHVQAQIRVVPRIVSAGEKEGETSKAGRQHVTATVLSSRPRAPRAFHWALAVLVSVHSPRSYRVSAFSPPPWIPSGVEDASCLLSLIRQCTRARAL